MKKTIAHLPRKKRRDLEYLTDIARAEIRNLEMVILFGSYARGTYVDWDERTEFGLHTSYQSDYDIILVTKKYLDDERGTYEKIEREFYRDKHPDLQTPPQFINMSVEELNGGIAGGRYFYTDIKKEGVMLWDSGRYKLARRRKLNFKQIKALAQEYYDEKFRYACQFLKHAMVDYNDGEYKLGSFHLHQATENFLHTITQVYSLYANKLHDLEKLLRKARPFTLDVTPVFPRDTEEEKRLFTLLRDAYVQARYNPKFAVTKADMDALIPKVERLRDIAEKVCAERMAYYDRMIAGEESSAPAL